MQQNLALKIASKYRRGYILLDISVHSGEILGLGIQSLAVWVIQISPIPTFPLKICVPKTIKTVSQMTKN